MPSSSTAPVVPAAVATAVVLRGAIVVTSAVGLLAMVVAAFVGGGLAALGAALGVVITVVFFASGQYAVTRILASRPEIALTGALAVYLGQILVLFVLIALLQDATWLDPKAFALTIVACTLVWVLMLVWGTQRYRVPTIEPAPSAPDADGDVGR